jgi:hypothetical protein
MEEEESVGRRGRTRHGVWYMNKSLEAERREMRERVFGTKET